MDINEVASRAASTPPPPRQVNLAPGLQTPQGSARLRDVSQTVLVQEPLASESASTGNPGGLEELRAAVEKIQEFVSSTASDIKFSIDEDSGRTVVKVIDRETQEVIRQIPSQEMLDLAQALDKLQGLLIKQKA
jgi:flagellar protein FlaG